MKLLNVLEVRCRCVVAVALVAASIARAQAQDSSASNHPTRLSVDALVAEALQNNPELRFYEAEISAAKGERRQAGAFPNPEVTGEFGRKRASGPGISAEGTAWSVSVMQPFEWPGRIGLRKAIANRDLELAELGYERFRAALAGRMRRLSFEVFAAGEKAAAAREVAERFEALREVLVQRDPAGLTPLLETRVIEATELSAQRKATEAAIAARIALIELNQLRGAPPNSPVSIGRTAMSFAPLPPDEHLLRLALTNNFDLRARAAELAQQGFRVALARSERFPTLAVGPTYSEEKAGEREQTVGIGVSVPLPLWNRNSGAIQAAKARETQAEVSYAITQREMERLLAKAIASYRAKVQEIGKWLPDSIQHFRDTAELADRHYRLGAVQIGTYVELQEKYLEAVEGLLETKKEALEAAEEIQQLTGLREPLVQAKEVDP